MLSDIHAHIVCVAPNFIPRIGGFESHFYQVGTLLNKIGHRVSVLTRRIIGMPKFQSINGISVHRFGFPLLGSLDEGQFMKGIIRHVRRAEFPQTVFYVFLSVRSGTRTKQILELLKILKAKRVPVVVRVTSSNRVTELCIMYPDAIKTLREVECVISLNAGIYRELLSSGVPEAKIVAIPNGVDVDLFKPSEEVRKLMRRGIGCDLNTLVFLCTTRFAPKKRLPKLLQAWKEIEKNLADSSSPELWIVGGNSSEFAEARERRELIRLIRQLGLQHVRLFASEPHSEMPKYYQTADIYVTFSEEEGMSNSMLEAMSTGLVVIGPCVDAVTQLVENRFNGFLFGHENGHGPVEAIRTCIQLTPTQRKQLGMTNRLLMCERYRIDQVAKQFSKLFDQLILHSQNTET